MLSIVFVCAFIFICWHFFVLVWHILFFPLLAYSCFARSAPSMSRPFDGFCFCWIDWENIKIVYKYCLPVCLQLCSKLCACTVIKKTNKICYLVVILLGWLVPEHHATNSVEIANCKPLRTNNKIIIIHTYLQTFLVGHAF